MRRPLVDRNVGDWSLRPVRAVARGAGTGRGGHPVSFALYVHFVVARCSVIGGARFRPVVMTALAMITGMARPRISTSNLLRPKLLWRAPKLPTSLQPLRTPATKYL